MVSKTRWEKIVSDKDLAAIQSLRSKTFITSKERREDLDELTVKGWIPFREYSNPKFIGVKKEKPFDEQFEDKVWMLFAKMGFTHMNSDRHFEMSYDFQNPDNTQQIDVFAADEECVIIVECKAAEKPREVTFKKEIEALRGQMDGLAKEARRQFPKSKVKFIWATHNIILSKADQDRLNDWDIIHFSDTTVDYYSELVKHLGSSAKYQLLGNLFAKAEISNMEDRIPAIQGKMGNHTYYSFSIEPERLLKIGYVLHRKEANKSMMPTYQRLIKKKRLTEVQKFVNEGGYFPNSLIISIDTNGRGLQFDAASMKVDGCISRIGILHLPKRYRSAYIIDGQHRLYGYSDSAYASNNSIPVVAFVDLDQQEQMKIFMDINENQKSVDKSLRVVLNADTLWESDDYNERRQALRSKIAQMLAEETTSPLLNRIVVSDDDGSPLRNITVEAIQSAIKKCNFFTVFGKKNIIVKDGTFDLGTNQDTCDLFYPFIEECLLYVKKHAPDEWDRSDKDGGMITINRGIQAIIRVINDIVNHLIDNHEISPKTQPTNEVVKKVCFYLDPLNDYLNHLTDDQRKDLRGYFGGGADTRFWRAYQKAVSDGRTDFQPVGLVEYWIDEAKTFNKESVQYLYEIQGIVKKLIANKLESHYGTNWIIKALPRPIYDRAKSEADDQNYESIKNGNESTVTVWDCITLTECKTIVTSGNHWTTIFEDVLTRPEDKTVSGNKDSRTDWLQQLNTINNKLTKPSYSVSVKEFEFIKSIYEWLK